VEGKGVSHDLIHSCDESHHEYPAEGMQSCASLSLPGKLILDSNIDDYKNVDVADFVASFVAASVVAVARVFVAVVAAAVTIFDVSYYENHV
jgi:hypothetical protein